MARDTLQTFVNQQYKDPQARKEAYYHLQRLQAEEAGNQAMSDRINKKLGRKSSSVDTEAVNKGILGTVPFLAGPGEAKLAYGVAKRLAPEAAQAVEGAAGRVMSGVGEAASKLFNRGGKRSGGTVAKDFAKSIASNPVTKATTRVASKAAPKETRNFTESGARKNPKLKAGEKERVMSSMREVKPKENKRPPVSAEHGRSGREKVKDFGAQAKQTHKKPAPSSPSHAKGFSGGGYGKSASAHGKAKSSKKAY